MPTQPPDIPTAIMPTVSCVCRTDTSGEDGQSLCMGQCNEGDTGVYVCMYSCLALFNIPYGACLSEICLESMLITVKHHSQINQTYHVFILEFIALNGVGCFRVSLSMFTNQQPSSQAADYCSKYDSAALALLEKDDKEDLFLSSSPKTLAIENNLVYWISDESCGSSQNGCAIDGLVVSDKERNNEAQVICELSASLCNTLVGK